MDTPVEGQTFESFAEFEKFLHKYYEATASTFGDVAFSRNYRPPKIRRHSLSVYLFIFSFTFSLLLVN